MLIFPLKVKMPFSSRLAYVLLQSSRTRFTITAPTFWSGGAFS